MTKTNDTTLYIGGKIAGVVRGDVLDIRKSQQHFVRKFGGYGIDPETLDEGERQGATTIKLTVLESGHVFTCTIDEWRRYAVPADLGAGRQLFMPLTSIRYCESNRSQLHKNEPVPIQFGLWGK